MFSNLSITYFINFYTFLEHLRLLFYIFWYDPMTSFTVMYDDIGNTFQDLKTTLSLLNSGSTSHVSGLILPNIILANHTSIGASTDSFNPTW